MACPLRSTGPRLSGEQLHVDYKLLSQLILKSTKQGTIPFQIQCLLHFFFNLIIYYFLFYNQEKMLHQQTEALLG